MTRVIQRAPNTMDGENGTWLEPEEKSYSGAYRKCAALDESGNLVVVRCKLADTMFSIEARTSKGRKGFVYMKDGTFRFKEYA